MMNELLDPLLWHRAGSGLRRELEQVRVEEFPALWGVLPPRYAPYKLVAGPRPDAHAPRRCRPIEVAELEAETGEGVWQFFVVSVALSQGFLEELLVSDVQTLAVNGALNIQIGRPDPRGGGVAATTVGVVNRVATADGRERFHGESVEILEAIVRFNRSLRRR